MTHDKERKLGLPTSEWLNSEEYLQLRWRLFYSENALDRIDAFLTLDEKWDNYLRELVRFARHQGASWQEIADVFGVSRQAAHGRFSSVNEVPFSEVEEEFNEVRPPIPMAPPRRPRRPRRSR